MILTAIINHLTPNLVGARRRRALPQSCRIPQREPQRLRYLGENMKVLVLLVSFPIRNHVGWGNWRFQISHVPVFFNFRTQQILHNRLLLLALRLLSPNRDTSTKVSQYFSTFCQTLLSFYFPNIVCFFLKKSLDLRNSHSLGWSLPPVPLWIHHTKETVSMATRLLKKKKTMETFAPYFLSWCPLHCCVQGMETTLVTRDAALHWFSHELRSHYQLLGLFSHQLKQFSCEMGMFSLLPFAGPF